MFPFSTDAVLPYVGMFRELELYEIQHFFKMDVQVPFTLKLTSTEIEG